MDLYDQLRDKIADLIGFHTEGLNKLEMQYIAERIIKDAVEPYLDNVRELNESLEEKSATAH